MHTRKLALAAVLAVGGALAVGFAPQAPAAGYVSISVGTPPPPLRYEVVPVPRPGYVWAPGYWRWTHRHYVWVGGTWDRDRPGYVYQSPRWVHSGDRWVYHDRYWNRDPRWHDNGRHRGWDHDRGHGNGHGYDHHHHDHDDDHDGHR